MNLFVHNEKVDFFILRKFLDLIIDQVSSTSYFIMNFTFGLLLFLSHIDVQIKSY